MALKDLDNLLQAELATGKEKSSAYANGLTLAFETNPDVEAQKQKLQKTTGIPAALMDDETKQLAELQNFLSSKGVTDLPTKAPLTANWISQQENANIAHDDIEALVDLEALAKAGPNAPGAKSTLRFNTEQDQGRVRSVSGAFMDALKSSPDMVAGGLAEPGVWLGDFVEWSLRPFADPLGQRKQVADALRYSASYWDRNVKMRQKEYKPGSPESYGQMVGGSIGTSLLAAPFGLAGENAALGAFALFAGGGYQDMVDSGTSIPMAIALSGSNKAMEGLTEKLGMDALYGGKGPIIKKAVKFLLGDLAGEEVNALYNLGVSKVTVNPDMTMEQVVQQLVDTAIVTAFAGPIQGGTMGGVSRASGALYDAQLKRATAKDQEGFLLALGDSVRGTKTFKRMPEKVQALIQEIKKDGAVQDIYIPVEHFNELFQAQGMSPEEAAIQILSNPSRYDEAVATGGDIAIPLEEFAKLADAPYYAELARNAKTHFGSLSAREAEDLDSQTEIMQSQILDLAQEDTAPVEETEVNQAFRQMTPEQRAAVIEEEKAKLAAGEDAGELQKQIADFEKIAAEKPGQYEAYQRIHEDTYEQLLAVGRPPQEARDHAEVRATALSTLAAQHGYDYKDLLNRFPVRVTNGGDVQIPSGPFAGKTYANVFAEGTAWVKAENARRENPAAKVSPREQQFRDMAAIDAADIETNATNAEALVIDGHKKKATISANTFAHRWYLDAGYPAADVVATLKNIAKGKQLTENQQVIAGDWAESNKALQSKFMTGVTAGDLQEGDEFTAMIDDKLDDFTVVKVEGGDVTLKDGVVKTGDFFDSIEIVGGIAGVTNKEAEADPEETRPVTMDDYFTLHGAQIPSRLDQGGVDDKTGLPLNADGTVTVYHHTSKEKAAKIRESGTLKATAEPDVYVTTRKEPDTGYGDTAVSIQVNPSLLEIDDEFPDGRVDYRLNVGKPGGSIKVKVIEPVELSKILADLKQKFPDMNLAVFESKGKISVNRIQFPKEQQGQGNGSVVMATLTEYADATGQVITLTPSSDFGGTKSRVVSFNKRFGFVENKGKNKDFAISDTMYRLPKKEKDRTLFQGGSAEGHETFSVRKTQEEGMLLTATVTDGVTKVSGIGATHYDASTTMKTTLPEGLTNGTGFVTPDGIFLRRKEAVQWLKENRNDAYRALDKITRTNGLESQAYAFAEGVVTGIDNSIEDFIRQQFGADARTLFQSIAYKVKPPKKLYRGVAEGLQEDGSSGSGIYSMGKGLYSSPDKSFAKKYGKVIEISIADGWPVNPLVLYNVAGGAPAALNDWMLKESGEKNIREFNKKWSDPGDFIRSKGYDGVVAGNEVVKYSVSNSGTYGENDPNILFQPVYHGTPHKFDKFSLAAMGTGEGVQAFGWGLYFAGKKEVAEFYRDNLTPREIKEFSIGTLKFYKDQAPLDYSPRFNIDGNDAIPRATLMESIFIEENTIRRAFEEGGEEAAKKEILRVIDEYLDVYEGEDTGHVAYGKRIKSRIESGIMKVSLRLTDPGNVYQVDIPEDDVMLQWDKPLSAQSEKVQAALVGLEGEGYQKWLNATFNGGMSPESLLEIATTIDRNNTIDEEWDENTSEQEKLDDIKSFFDYLHENDPESFEEYVGGVGFSDQQEGRGIYEQLSVAKGGPEAASRYLDSLGIKGIMFADGTSRDKEEDQTFNYVIFDDSVVTIEAVNDEIIQARELEQGPKGNRGYIRFGGSLEGFEIGLLKDANPSTFIHELGHYYMEILGDLAQDEGAPDALKADYATLLKWVGAKDRASLSVEQLEQIARGYEAYHWEGKAPSEKLRAVFARISVWFKAVYRTLKELNVELTPEVRDVFDRLLATDEEIAQAKQNAKPLYATAADAGMTPTVFAAYQKLAEQAQADAASRLDVAKMRDFLREQQQWWKDARDAMQEQIEKEAQDNPVYQLLHLIYNGELFDGSPYEGGQSRLSGVMLKEQIDPKKMKLLRKKLGNVYVNKGGIDPQLASEQFGFSSVDEMVERLLSEPKMKAWVKEETDRRMEEQHGHMDPMKIAQEALSAVHNDYEATLLREELKAINKKRREVKPFTDAEKKQGKEDLQDEKAERRYERRWMDAEAKLKVAEAKAAGKEEIDALKEEIRSNKKLQIAARNVAKDLVPPIASFKSAAVLFISKMKVQEILPGKFAQGEQKAAKEAFALNGQGKYEEAAQAKTRQLLNHYLYREATKAREEAESIAKRMRKLGEGKSQARIGKAGQDYLEQVNGLLDQYEFAKVTYKELDARESLKAWVKRKTEANGFPPPIAPGILEEASRINYKTLTVQSLHDVAETVDIIVHLSRVDGKIQKEQEKQDIADLVDMGAESIAEHSKGKKKRHIEKRLTQDEFGNGMDNYFASHRKLSSLARQMDGGQDGGAMWNLYMRPLNEAADKEAAMRAAAAEAFQEIFTVYSVRERAQMSKREHIPALGDSLSKWGRLMVALNMGNDGNRQRLGSMFTPEQVAAIIDTLDERDVQFVQSVWDFIGSYWSEIKAKEKRVNGVAPQRVEPTPWVTKFGIKAGGYFPISYDAVETPKAGAQQQQEILQQIMGGAFSRATTRHGHTEARLEALDRPLNLSIDVVFNHVNQVIHDLTHHEVLYDVSRIMGTSAMQKAVVDHYGIEIYKVMTEGLRDIAIGDIPAQNAFERFMNYTRIGISTASLGYNLVTAMMQPMGLTQSIVRIGWKPVAKGISRAIGTPEMMGKTADWIYEQSSFMKTRGLTQNREINEIRNQLDVGLVPHAVKESYFYFIQQMQRVVDIPTWLGQYEKSMAEHGDEKSAVLEADQAVIDSQASGQMKDLARIQKGGAYQKMFTTFYSYFSTTYNLAAESKARTDFKNPLEVGRFIVDMLMLYVVPVVLTMALKAAINFAIGGDDDDKDFGEIAKDFAGESLGYLLGGFIGAREFGSVLAGFAGYQGPAGARFYSDASKLAKELAQGELDGGLVKSLNAVGGILFHYPALQIQRTAQGIIEIKEGRGNALSLLFGKPRKN
jgi:hypothetical protein